MILINSLIKIIICLTNLQFGIATIFWEHTDKYNPVAYGACLKRDLRDSDFVVAHKTLPCKSKVFIYNIRTGRSAIARVGDRGPRKAAIDLHKVVAERLKLNGKEHVIFFPLPEG